jgi:hypothetical protein
LLLHVAAPRRRRRSYVEGRALKQLNTPFQPRVRNKHHNNNQADDETRALLIKMAGPGAVARGWVYFTEVKSIPAEDLQTVRRARFE